LEGDDTEVPDRRISGLCLGASQGASR